VSFITIQNNVPITMEKHLMSCEPFSDFSLVSLLSSDAFDIFGIREDIASSGNNSPFPASSGHSAVCENWAAVRNLTFHDFMTRGPLRLS
jgi:hypothetical protein